MKRIIVVGNSGAGKSTLASELADRLGLPWIASDPFYWDVNWKPAEPATVRQRIINAITGDFWVIDGNCIAERDIVWKKADTLIWLDYSFSVVLLRVCFRNMKFVITQEVTWSGNRMTIGRAGSGIRHAWSTYSHKRVTYPNFLIEYPHLTVLHFQTPNDATQWLTRISSK